MPDVQRCQIEIKSVISVLEAMRQAKPLGQNPLIQFICLTQPGKSRGFVAGSVGIDNRIFCGLVQIICRRLSQHREIYGLPPVAWPKGKNGDLSALCNDFRFANAELEAWSLLYHRYVRVDLALSMGQISQTVKQPERTLNRRSRLGAVRLTHELVRREVQARSKQSQTLLRAKLTRQYSPYLVGRDLELKLAFEHLSASSRPQHLILHGERGVGKTALALALTHKLIESELIQSVVWINNPQPSFEWLEGETMLQLGLPQGESSLALPVYLQNVDTLVILDQAQPILDNVTLLSRLVSVLGAARLIMCAAYLPEEVFDMACLLVPPLDKEAAIELLEHLAQVRDLSNRDNLVDKFASLFKELGGNPRALRCALLPKRSSTPAVVQP